SIRALRGRPCDYCQPIELPGRRVGFAKCSTNFTVRYERRTSRGDEVNAEIRFEVPLLYHHAVPGNCGCWRCECCVNASGSVSPDRYAGRCGCDLLFRYAAGTD